MPPNAGPTLNRRSLLKLGALGSAGLWGTLAPAAIAAPPAPTTSPERTARTRNLIFLAADGMSTGTLTLAELHCRTYAQTSCNWWKLWSRPGVRRATATTFSADSFVTDSAAAGSAWGIGHHINNGVVNILPDGRQLTPLLAHARQNGKATGLVTTTRITHATPASFIANAPKRDMENMIARQQLDRGVDVLLGGGERHFKPEWLKQAPDLTLLRSAADLPIAANAKGRLLGLFAPAHMPMVLDRDANTPSLAAMTDLALRRLEHAPEGFVLQVEGGRIDHAAHSNDAASLIAEMLDFDAAIAAALQFADNRDDTLLILTTDHANANPGLTFYGQPGIERFARLDQVNHSFEWVEAQLAAASGVTATNNKPDREAMADAVPGILAKLANFEVPAADRELLQRHLRGERIMPLREANTWTSILGQILAQQVGVAFCSPNHTADAVEVTALGPGSERLPMAIDNTDLHTLAVEALGLQPAEPLPGNEAIIKLGAPVVDD